MGRWALGGTSGCPAGAAARLVLPGGGEADDGGAEVAVEEQGGVGVGLGAGGGGEVLGQGGDEGGVRVLGGGVAQQVQGAVVLYEGFGVEGGLSGCGGAGGQDDGVGEAVQRSAHARPGVVAEFGVG